MKEMALRRLRRHGPAAFCAAVIAAGFALAFALTPPLLAVSAQSAEKSPRFYRHSSGLGADGYDVVAYFSDSRPVRGDDDFAVKHGGTEWRFVSAANRDAFLANPARYLPRYGGHCAYGVAQGYLVRGDPKAWSIHGGALFFNYNIPIRDRWLADRDSYIQESERVWPKLAR